MAHVTTFPPRVADAGSFPPNVVLPAGGAAGVGETLDAVAGLAVGDVIYVTAGGVADKAFAGVVGQTAKAVGVVADVLAATSVRVVSDGAIVDGFAGLVEGTEYFLSDGAAGGIVAVAPGGVGERIQSIGIGYSPTQLFVKVSTVSVVV